MLKKISFSILLLAICVSNIFAQKEASKTTFAPSWNLHIQGGVGYTIGETDFNKLLSPAAAISISRTFNPVLGLRFGISGIGAKGGLYETNNNYSFNYAQANLDALVYLPSIFSSYKSDRLFNPYIFGGVGLNYAFNNDEAVALAAKYTSVNYFYYLWNDSKISPVGRFGIGTDIRLSKSIALSLEVNSNVMSDKFNSKRAYNSDWQFNGLVGLKINLGGSKKSAAPAPVSKAPVPVAEPEPKPEPKKEEPAPKPEPKPAVVVVDPLQENVFFDRNSTVIKESESAKVESLVSYLEKYPKSKVSIIGYADKATGNASINSRLASTRAEVVSKALEAKGISKDRISTASKGDTVQPFNVSEDNRVAICIAE